MARKKLTRVEILAVKAAVKAGMHMRKLMIAGIGYTYPLYGRDYMRGYWTAIQMITSQLPDARKTVRLCRIYERCARSIKSCAPRACPSVPVSVSSCPSTHSPVRSSTTL